MNDSPDNSMAAERPALKTQNSKLKTQRRDHRSLVLITGGARSGKSAFAQRLAESRGGEVLFVATAEALDDEMAERIARHRADRPAHWRTLEAPRGLAGALAAAPPAPIVLLDCVTLWVTNLLLAEGAAWDSAVAELDALLAWRRASRAELIAVTNEVGLGIVPADLLSRTYRDWLGAFNQRLAAEAGSVYLCVAGIPLEIKRLAQGEGDALGAAGELTIV
jgi:adenosylcobinamide kinase/adenosylcobinamide-phosphate guanylyltransferase